jgi:hypothetical protein
VSYARFSYADVYVFINVRGYLDCCGCWLRSGGEPAHFFTTDAMIAHLREHQGAGHDIANAIEELEADRAENDAWMAKVGAGMCPSCDGDGWCHNCKNCRRPCGFFGHVEETWPGPCWECDGDGRRRTVDEIFGRAEASMRTEEP